MAVYGYARVSTDDQDTAIQVAALKAAGCSIVVKRRSLERAATDERSLKRFSLSCAKAMC